MAVQLPVAPHAVHHKHSAWCQAVRIALCYVVTPPAVLCLQLSDSPLTHLTLSFLQVHDFPMLVSDGGQLLQAELLVSQQQQCIWHSWPAAACTPLSIATCNACTANCRQSFACP